MSKQSRARAALRTASLEKPSSLFVRRGSLLAGCVVVLAAWVVYARSFSGPFILDDEWSITTNPTIHHVGSALSPPPDKGTGGRPLLNLTFALNYAQDGLNVWDYHAFNLFIHALAGLVLFGIVRRTLASLDATRGSEISNLRFEIGADATPLALAIAVIWVVHPLQTEAVTYISQRAESLMGLFYLLTLYFFIRGVEDARTSNAESPTTNYKLPTTERRRRPGYSSSLWMLASVGACLLGAMSKEIIVTAPVMVLLYDRTFVAGSFREAWRLRWRYYLGLACTWLLLACLMTHLGQRSIGFGQGVTWWNYALTSCQSVVLYLKLAIWPHPLVFDYGANIIQQATEALPYALILLVLLAAVAMALRYWPAIGFAGAWFFVILAPTSSVIPLADQPMAEHRMYLSLAAVVALGVLGVHAWMGRRSLILFAAVAAGLGWLSVERNKDYLTAQAIWSDTVAKRPDNARARYNLGNALHDIPGRLPDAVAQFEAAVRFHPDSSLAHYNFANVLNDAGRIPEAIAQYDEALRLDPNNAQAHNNLGSALLINLPGRLPDAISHFEKALQINPHYAEAHYDFGIALDRAGRKPEAIAQYEEALRIRPEFAAARAALEQAQAAAK
ncbi:MAG TPA: tetratricopeptide repeat protein [Opitutaceae bacterium]|nr:tetratricopeptide repeat protein [Opitutaceae bacterium]